MGKTNMDQFAAGLVGTRTPHAVPRSPFDCRFISGGSSSGSGAAVGSGLVSFALGTDTAGSGRVPAGLCGCVGVKPTVGSVSTVGGCRVGVRACGDSAMLVFLRGGRFVQRTGPAVPRAQHGKRVDAALQAHSTAALCAAFAGPRNTLADLLCQRVHRASFSASCPYYPL